MKIINSVIPAQAGISADFDIGEIPACAGMTEDVKSPAGAGCFSIGQRPM